MTFKIYSNLYKEMVFPDGSVVKNAPANTGDLGLVPGLGRFSGEGNGNPLLPGEFYGQKSLACYSLWGRKESDTPEAT